MDKASRETVPECNIQSQTLLPRVRVLEQKKKKMPFFVQTYIHYLSRYCLPTRREKKEKGGLVEKSSQLLRKKKNVINIQLKYVYLNSTEFFIDFSTVIAYTGVEKACFKVTNSG